MSGKGASWEDSLGEAILVVAAQQRPVQECLAESGYALAAELRKGEGWSGRLALLCNGPSRQPVRVRRRNRTGASVGQQVRVQLRHERGASARLGSKG